MKEKSVMKMSPFSLLVVSCGHKRSVCDANERHETLFFHPLIITHCVQRVASSASHSHTTSHAVKRLIVCSSLEGTKMQASVPHFLWRPKSRARTVIKDILNAQVSPADSETAGC